MVTTADIDSPDDRLVQLLRLLRRAANEGRPDWQSLAYVVQGGKAGIWHVAVAVGPQGPAAGWLGDHELAVLSLARDWWEDSQATGKPWHAVVAGTEHESGNFDAFFVAPGPDAQEWTIDPDTTNALIGRAYARLDVRPKYVEGRADAGE